MYEVVRRDRYRVGLVIVLILALSLTTLRSSNAESGGEEPKALSLDCEPEEATAPPETNSPITCTVTDSIGTGQPDVFVDAEVLAGSTHDHDGTAAPPDYQYATGPGGDTTLPYIGTAEGLDNMCLWIDADGIDENINEGDAGCTEDSDTDVVTRIWTGEAFDEVPVLDVRRNGIPSEKANRLRDALDIDGKILQDDGSILFVDPKRFAKVPTKPADAEDFPEDEDGMTVKARAIDFAALDAIKVLPAATARRKIGNALRAADLAPSDLLPIAFRDEDLLIDHGTFQTLGSPTTRRSARSAIPQVDVPLDTQVSYQLSFHKTPIVGPGANFRAAFDVNGHVTFLSMSARKLVEGKEIGIMSPQQAIDLCNEQAGTDGYDQAQLVYQMPSSAFEEASTVYPHYACNGSGVSDDDVFASEFLLRELLVPAVSDLLPRVTIAPSSTGGHVTATSNVTGGRPPYRYAWSSGTSEIPDSVSTTGTSIAYDLRTREESLPLAETVRLAVTDANGLPGFGEATLSVAPLPPGTPPETTEITVGAWYVGTSYRSYERLDGPAPNTRGFTTGMAPVARVLYNSGELNTWERDFKDADVDARGTDASGVDNVDMFWFNGHANGNGWLLSAGQRRDDDWVGYWDTRLGDRDLEWAAIAACGPLQPTSNGQTLVRRWGPTFEGLHILNGYASASQDTDMEGPILSNAMRGVQGFERLTVRQAWAAMAIAVQNPDVVHASMGPIGPGGVSNYNDFFWGQGPVGPDLRGTQIRDFWVYSAPS